MTEQLTDDEKRFYQSVFVGDVPLLRQLLKDNPNFVPKLKSDPSVISYAFQNPNRRFEVVKALVEHGFDVNVYTKGSLTPLSKAISKSAYDIAACLLEHGADPHLDRALISALNCDDGSLRLPFVKLLIKHGADVNQLNELYKAGSYFTALDWAKDVEIAAYLKAHGAKTATELQGISPEQMEAARVELRRRNVARTELIAYFNDNFGPVDEQPRVESLPSGITVAIYVIPPVEDRRHHTLFTWGLFETPMRVPAGEGRWALAEAYMQLPGDWQIDQLHDPRWKWPLEWLAKIVRYPRENETWLGGGFTIIANGEPPEPLAPNTGLTCLMLYASHSLKRSDGQEVPIYCVTPIYTEERDLELREGIPALMRAFDRAGVPFILNLGRPNVALN